MGVARSKVCMVWTASVKGKTKSFNRAQITKSFNRAQIYNGVNTKLFAPTNSITKSFNYSYPTRLIEHIFITVNVRESSGRLSNHQLVSIFITGYNGVLLLNAPAQLRLSNAIATATKQQM